MSTRGRGEIRVPRAVKRHCSISAICSKALWDLRECGVEVCSDIPIASVLLTCNCFIRWTGKG